jgi:hypothetical protein
VLQVRKLAVIASALLALGSAAVVFSSGPAFADSNVTFCNTNTNSSDLCAVSTGIPHFINMEVLGSTWVYYPNDATTEIRQYDTNDCMQVVPSSANEVRVAVCDSGSDQEFVPTAVSGGHTYRSELSGNLCLNDHWQVSALNAAPCNGGANQVFSPSGTP